MTDTAHHVAVDRRPSQSGRRFRAFSRDEGGATAIEFAFVAMPFFLIVFAILEISLAVFFGSLLNDAAHEAANYLRDETMKCTRQGSATVNCSAATIDGVRAAACSSITPGGMSCSAEKLKLAVYNADDPLANPIPASNMIEESNLDLASARAYVIAIGYEWPFSLPTTMLLLPNDGSRVQLQARVYYSTAERALR